MKETAIEWLNEQIRLNSKFKENSKGAITFSIGLSNIDELFKQSKEIEKEQIINSYNQVEFNYVCNGNAEQYYKETYK